MLTPPFRGHSTGPLLDGCLLLLLLQALVFLRGNKNSARLQPLGLCIEDLRGCLCRLAIYPLGSCVFELAADLLVLVDAVRVEVATTVDAPHPAIFEHLRLELALMHVGVACSEAGATLMPAAAIDLRCATRRAVPPCPHRAFLDVAWQIQLGNLLCAVGTRNDPLRTPLFTLLKVDGQRRRKELPIAEWACNSPSLRASHPRVMDSSRRKD
mmetsp:Transcript_80225/g.227153  ORF Transcript_80225/g.227153 Transcript_80225/m.227153 type:complete len:212 (-) Transcript_80225:31-666(-)